MARVYTCTRRERERERNKGVSVGGQQLDTGLGSMHTESLSLSPTPPALFQPLHPSRGSCTLRIVEPCFSPLPLATHRYRRRGRRGRRGFFPLSFSLSCPCLCTRRPLLLILLLLDPGTNLVDESSGMGSLKGGVERQDVF